jgi:3-oxoacyl-[acyl-carrier protein] reductase
MRDCSHAFFIWIGDSATLVDYNSDQGGPRMIDPGLTGKVAMVTGANHGIGAATAIEFARQGARVFLTYLRLSPQDYGGVEEREAAEATQPGRAYYYGKLTQSPADVVNTIHQLGALVEALEVDLSDPASLPQLFDQAEERFGQVDILVNNAAHDKPDTFLPPAELSKDPLFADEYPMRTVTASSHDEHFAVNSRAVVLLMEEFSRRIISRQANWGRIINISTDGAYCHPSNVSYGASKLAMEGYTRAAAVELGPYGITVNVISPGAVQTGWMPAELEESLRRQYPLRRVGRPEDIARAVVFFASTQADWITGQVLQVGGGNRM